MTDSTTDKNTNPEIVIVGSNTMQNELLISYLQPATGLNCSTCSAFDMTGEIEARSDHKTLFLIDSQGIPLPQILNQIDVGPNSVNSSCLFAVYNLDPDIEISSEALDRGLHGGFFKNEPLDNITKGIKSIMSGDFWYSRKTLSNYLRQQRATAKLKGELSSELTNREKEVLLKILSGLCNKEIAEEMNISFHTVKTHVYNIFRKLNVNSRFQATLWAAKNL